MRKKSVILGVIIIIVFAFGIYIEFSQKNFKFTAKKIALACVSDLHCNAQVYPEIGDKVKKLCETNDVVILAVNGDIFTKYDPKHFHIDNDGMGEDLNAFHEKHFLAPGGFADFFINLMGDNEKIGVVFNIGNHELMFEYAHLFVCFLKKIRDSVGERLHVVSNLKAKKPDVPMRLEGEIENGLVEFIKPSVAIEGIIFAGYCTTRIFNDTIFNGKSLYGYAREHFYALEEDAIAHDRVFVDNIRNAVKNRMGNLFLVALAHEGTHIFRDVWEKVERDSKNNGNYLSTMKQRIIVTGHAHGQNNNNCGIGERVVVPRVFGCGIEILELSIPCCSCLPRTSFQNFAKNLRFFDHLWRFWKFIFWWRFKSFGFKSRSRVRSSRKR
jgi:hypothetical protein